MVGAAAAARTGPADAAELGLTWWSGRGRRAAASLQTRALRRPAAAAEIILSSASAQGEGGGADARAPLHVPRPFSTETLILDAVPSGGSDPMRELSGPVHTRCTCAFRVNRPPWECHRISLACSAPGACLQGSTKSFAKRLNKCCDAAVKETEHGEQVLPGHACVAPGGHHPLVWKSGARCVAVVSDTPPPKRHRPSVEVSFQSGAEIAGLFVRDDADRIGQGCCADDAGNA